MDVTDTREVVVGGERIRYRVAGTGRPLVLLHGLAASGRWWRENVERLAEHRMVFLPDLPPRIPLARAPALLAEWLDALELPPIDLVGHSLGGLLAARVAADAPARVRRLVLVAPAGVSTNRRAAGYVLPLARSVWLAHPRFLRLLAADTVRARPHRVMRTALQLLTQDVTADLRRIEAPTLLVWGDQDTLVPPSLAQAWRREIPHARLALLAGARHVPMVEQPREFERALLEFLTPLATAPEEPPERAVEP